eukprot:s675_g22.t1
MNSQDSSVERLTQALERLTLAIERKGRSSTEEWEVISEGPESQGSGSKACSNLFKDILFGDYNSFAEVLPVCPDRIIGRCSVLRGGQYTSEYRAKRAWESGVWASLVLRGKIPKPRESLPMDLRPSVYIILQAPNLKSPARVSSASQLYRITGESGHLVLAEELAGVLVMDMSQSGAAGMVQPFPDDADLDVVNCFAAMDFQAHPDFGDLMAQVRAWLSSELGDRMAFYSAGEEAVPETPGRRGPRQRTPGSTGPAKAPAGAKAGSKKPTVATLSNQLDVVLNSLPVITEQLTQLTLRKDAMEKKVGGTNPNPPAFQPLAAGRSAMPASSRGQPGVYSMASTKDKGCYGTYIANGRQSESGWRGMGAHRREGEGGCAFPSGSSSPGAKQGIISTGGTFSCSRDRSYVRPFLFYTHHGRQGHCSERKTAARASSRVRPIQRRMSPTAKPAKGPSEIGGISLLAYLERYGGYGQNRELGMMQWSIAHVFDAMAKEEWDLAKDHLAMTAVMIEQAAVDSNRWNLAWLLRLLDDPPQNLWTSRGQTALSAQSWTTTALAYLKEAGLLTSKKSEVLSQGKSAGSEDGPVPKATPKRRPGKGGEKGGHTAATAVRQSHNQLIQVAASGRKNLQLMARLKELASAADALGLSQSPYTEKIQQERVKINNSDFPLLSPFSRLKLTGQGLWPAAGYLEPELYMAYQEPQFLELDKPIYNRGLPNFEVDSPDTVFELFQKWDGLGLLALHPVSGVTTGNSGRVKIFNNYKPEQWDRQIGDRRERNAWEARIPSPSAHLPLGTMIGRLAIPAGMGVKICITDRSDYYHQLAVSEERSRANVVWPPMQLRRFLELRAYGDYVERSKKRQIVDRTVHGDCLNGHRLSSLSLDLDTMVYGSFKAILQGDHLGVEFGISAHVGFLKRHGLLAEGGRLVSNELIKPSNVYEGLVIDDYFCLAPVPQDEFSCQGQPSEAYRSFKKAKEAYRKAGLNGSDPKDVEDQVVATVVGEQVDSRSENVLQGGLPVGAPAEKRLALCWITFASARYPCTTDALHSSLLGALVSVMCFRQSSMSIFDELFKVVPNDVGSSVDAHFGK